MQRPAQRTGAAASAIGKVARRTQHVSCPPRHVAADLGQDGCPLLALDELGLELILELAYLHRQCRLADRTFLGGTPEVAVTGQCIEISQLAQCQHRLQVSDQTRGYFTPLFVKKRCMFALTWIKG
jgi:hypothetical protein